MVKKLIRHPSYRDSERLFSTSRSTDLNLAENVEDRRINSDHHQNLGFKGEEKTNTQNN